MSLSKEAIQHLEKSEVLNAVSTALNSAGTKSNLLAVPGGFDVQNLEQFMPNRDSYRFNYKTKSIKDFGAYCEEFDQDGAKCFIDSERMKAEVIFDLGSETLPLHQRHKAGLNLDKTAAFKAILEVNGDRLSQKNAADFLEDWSDNIACTTQHGEAMKTSQAVLQLRELTIDQMRSIESKVGDFSESMTQNEKIEAKNQDKLPAFISFVCDPYHGLEKREFTIRLGIITGSAKPEISFRIIKLEAQEEDIAEEFKEVLVDMFKDGKIKTFIGCGS